MVFNKRMQAALRVTFGEGDLKGLFGADAEWDALLADFYESSATCTILRVEFKSVQSDTSIKKHTLSENDGTESTAQLLKNSSFFTPSDGL